MATITIPDELADRLHKLSAEEGIPLEAWLTRHVDQQQAGSAPALIDQGDLLKRFTETDPSMLYVFDLELGKNIYVNQYTELFFGLTFAEMEARGQLFLIEALHPDDLKRMVEFQIQWDSASDSDVFVRTYRLKNTQGEYRWIRSFERILYRNPARAPTHLIGTAIDVTEEKEAQSKNEMAEARFKAIFENALDGILLANDKGMYVDANPAICEMLGYSREELLQMGVWDITPAPKIEYTREMWEAFEAEGAQTGNFTLKHKDGHEIQAEYMATYNIMPGLHLSILHDVSKRQAAAEALKLSEARYRAVASNFPNGMVALYDHELTYTLVDGEGLAEIGMSPSDLEGKRLRDIFPPEVYKRDEPALLHALEGQRIESIVPYGPGQFFKVVTLPVYDENNEIVSGMVMSQNVSPLINAETQLKELIDQLELSIETAQIGTWVLDLATDRLEWNNVQHKIYGITPEEFAEDMDGWRNAVHPEDSEYANGRFEEIFSKGFVQDISFRIVRPKTGEVRNILASGRALYDSEGKITKVIGVNLDMTNYELAQQSLRASEARYRALFNGSLNPIVVYDEDANIVMLNEEAAKSFNRPRRDAIGRSLKEIYPQYHELVHQRIQRVLYTKESMLAEDFIQIGDQEAWLMSLVQPIFDEGTKQNRVQIISYDITEAHQAEQLEQERTELKQKLAQEQELAQLRSKLISIISHELRTPLSVITTSSELLVKYADRLTDEKKEQKLHIILEQVSHLTRLLDEVSVLARANRGFLEYQPKLTDLAAFGQSIMDEMQESAIETQKLIFEADLKDEKALLDPHLMHLALINLVYNSIKYSPEGGEICLTLRQDAQYTYFVVEDHGIGIPEADQTDLFKPFHRANNVGQIRGTGLGLSIVKEAVDQHNGTVEYDSELGRGSTFTIVIPTTQQE